MKKWDKKKLKLIGVILVVEVVIIGILIASLLYSNGMSRQEDGEILPENWGEIDWK